MATVIFETKDSTGQYVEVSRTEVESFPTFVTSTTYAWGKGGHLIRTVTRLRNVGPGNQVVMSEGSSECYANASDYAYGVEFANQVAEDEYLAGFGA